MKVRTHDAIFWGLSAIYSALAAFMACTPAERADIASAAAKSAPCVEACAPLIEEVIASDGDAGQTASLLAFSLPPAPKGKHVHMHRRCTGWLPVLLDAGADADAEAGP